jgi:hypothetical protein
MLRWRESGEDADGRAAGNSLDVQVKYLLVEVSIDDEYLLRGRDKKRAQVVRVRTEAPFNGCSRWELPGRQAVQARMGALPSILDALVAN